MCVDLYAENVLLLKVILYISKMISTFIKHICVHAYCVCVVRCNVHTIDKLMGMYIIISSSFLFENSFRTLNICLTVTL